MKLGWGGAAILAGAAWAMPAAALELEFGATADARPYVCGGIGVEERQALARARPDFSLRVATAARGSGAFLAGVRVRILDAGGREVLARELSGPILLVDLLPGPYVVEAATAGQVRHRRTTVMQGGAREIYFYFDVPADALPGARAGGAMTGGREASN